MLRVFGVFTLALPLLALAAARVALKTQTVLTPELLVNGISPAMTGPGHTLFLKLDLAPGTSRYWLKGMKVEVLDTKLAPQPLNLLCHAFVIPPGSKFQGQSGLLTISEGMGEMLFPEGYGIVVDAAEKDGLQLIAQAMSSDPNYRKSIRYRFTVSYLEEGAGQSIGLKPLKQVSMSAHGPTAQLKNGAWCMAESDASGMSTHFLVPPGKHTFRRMIPGNQLVPGAARIKFIKLHLHKYGESVALWDRTASKLVWEGKARYRDGEIDETAYYSDKRGLELFADHQYEVVAEYNNWSKEASDGMAVLRTYVAENE